MSTLAITKRHGAKDQNDHRHRNQILRAIKWHAKTSTDHIHQYDTHFDDKAQGAKVGGQANQPVRPDAQMRDHLYLACIAACAA